MATFKTSKALGQTITIIVAASTGYWKYNHDGVDSAVYPSMASDSNGIQATITNANGEFTLIACTPDGASPSYGYVGMVNLQNQQITSFNATALTDITWLKLSDNPLTSSINNQILHQLVLHGKHYGYFATTGGRTPAGNSDYNNLLTNKHWTLEGLNLIISEYNKLRVKGFRPPTPTPSGSTVTPTPTPSGSTSGSTVTPTPTPSGSTSGSTVTPTPTPSGSTVTPTPTPSGSTVTPTPTPSGTPSGTPTVTPTSTSGMTGTTGTTVTTSGSTSGTT